MDISNSRLHLFAFQTKHKMIIKNYLALGPTDALLGDIPLYPQLLLCHSLSQLKGTHVYSVNLPNKHLLYDVELSIPRMCLPSFFLSYNFKLSMLSITDRETLEKSLPVKGFPIAICVGSPNKTLKLPLSGVALLCQSTQCSPCLLQVVKSFFTLPHLASACCTL